MVKVWWRRISFRRGELGWAGSIALALACVAVATLARMLMGLIGPTLTFATYFPAVLVASLLGGRMTGLLSIPFSIVAVWWAFIPPSFAFGRLNAVDIANFILFTLSGLLVVALALAHRRILFDLEDREKQRDLLVHELEHRSKNSLAVIASLIQQTITDKDEVDTLISRIRVAADNRDLLDEASDAMNLRELLAASIEKNYGKNRVMLTGPSVQLNGHQAHSLRIVFHELTTNALKYGALSDARGKIRIDWSREGKTLAISWNEIGGPKVAPPVKHNFGSRLINFTLKQMDARLEPTFAETGYCYRISFDVE